MWKTFFFFFFFFCRVITTLEKLKNEAAEITQKVKETDTIMMEVEAVTEQYRTLAAACSSIYFTMEGFFTVHFMYQFALKFFLEIFQSILYDNKHLQDQKDPVVRLNILIECLSQVNFDIEWNATYITLLCTSMIIWLSFNFKILG